MLISLFYKILGVNIGKKTFLTVGNISGVYKNIRIGNFVKIYSRYWLLCLNKNSSIIIGDNVCIGKDFTCSSNRGISIGSGTLISYRVSLIDHKHIFDMKNSPCVNGITQGNKINIGKNCFIGSGVIIQEGVTLGNNVIVGANSVVTKSFSSGSLIGGIPAKILK